jgi:cytochrome b subunit of formate dehydrogenase
LGQRWEHAVLILCVLVLLLTGLPQKYRDTGWSQWLLSTPERVYLIQQIHHITALVLTAAVLYHIGRAFYLIFRRRLPGDMLPNTQDLRDAWQMTRYLFFLTRKKPAYGKYSFEQKFTYWFCFWVLGSGGLRVYSTGSLRQ